MTDSGARDAEAVLRYAYVAIAFIVDAAAVAMFWVGFVFAAGIPFFVFILMPALGNPQPDVPIVRTTAAGLATMGLGVVVGLAALKLNLTTEEAWKHVS